MRKAWLLTVYMAAMFGIVIPRTPLFTDKTWREGMANGAIGLICSAFLGVIVLWWAPKKRRDWGLDEDEHQEQYP